MDAAYRDEFEQFKQTNAKWQETFLSRIEQCLIQKGTLRTLQDAVGITGMPFFKLSEKEPENLENHAVVERSAETRARRNCAFRNLRNGYSGKLFKNPCSQAELNKIVPFGFSLQRQKNGVFLPLK